MRRQMKAFAEVRNYQAVSRDIKEAANSGGFLLTVMDERFCQYTKIMLESEGYTVKHDRNTWYISWK